jgi:hypothetical protein
MNKSKGKLKDTLRILYEIETGKYKSLKYRSSYLLNYRALVENRDNATESEILVYLHLTSLRSIHEYMTRKATTLPIELASVYYSIEALKRNRLLTVNNNSIQFKYEYNGEITNV